MRRYSPPQENGVVEKLRNDQNNDHLNRVRNALDNMADAELATTAETVLKDRDYVPDKYTRIIHDIVSYYRQTKQLLPRQIITLKIHLSQRPKFWF